MKDVKEITQIVKQDAIDIQNGFYQPSYTMIEEELAPGCYLYRLVPNEEKQERIEKRLSEEQEGFFKKALNYLKKPFTSDTQ